MKTFIFCCVVPVFLLVQTNGMSQETAEKSAVVETKEVKSAGSIFYKGVGDGAGKGKHIVFIASDHEYRAEEAMPALARIASQHHGFDCTVCFGIDDKGVIQPGSSNVPGLEALATADLMVIFTRFLDLPNDQMRHIDKYLTRGGPVVGFRTASHAFKIDKKDKKYAKYSFKYSGKEFKNGFGEQILGNTWEGHHGKNHKEGTRQIIVQEQKEHPILKGVNDGAFNHAGSYGSKVFDDFVVLTKTQPLQAMKKDAKVHPTKKPFASTWTRTYKNKDGKDFRVFHSTQGASQDLLDDDYRRMAVNAIFWAAGLEEQIKDDLKIDFVGEYSPRDFRHYERGKKMTFSKPEAYADLNSAIPVASSK